MLSILSLILLGSIDKVTVLADRAEVVRIESGVCVRGRAEVVFDGLPMSLDERTLQATSSATVLGSTTRVIAAAVPARRKELEDALNAARQRLRDLRELGAAHIEEANQVAAYVRYVDPLMREEMRGSKPNPEAWKRTLDTLQARALAARTQALSLDPEERKLQRDIAKLEMKLRLLNSAPAVDARSVTVAVECASNAATARVSLGYVVPGASWHPEYEIHFTPEKEGKTGRGKVEITVAAVVAQSTGEDWKDATITLSTARPRLGAEVPQPAPIIVDGYETNEDNVMVQGTEDRSSLSGSSGLGGMAGPQRVELGDGGRAFTLSFPARATIASDGRNYWLPVDEVSGTAEARLVSIPKLSPHVYQTLAFESPARYPLLAGRARMHRGSSFVGEVSLEHVAPRAPVEVSLGIDGELQIERKDVESLDRAPGFLSGTRKLQRHLRFTVTNQSAAPQKIEVRENIPVSKDEELVIDIDKKLTGTGYKHDVERGFLVWTLDVASSKARSVDLAYVVKLPDSWRIQ